MRLAEQGYRLAAVEAREDARLGGDLADAVQRAGVEAVGRRVRLCLQPDAHVFDGAREDGVGEPGEGAGGVVLGV